MAKYQITAKNLSGQEFNEVIDAPSKDQAVLEVQTKDLFVLSVKEVVENVPVKKVEHAAPVEFKRKFTHNRASLDDIVSFSRQFATMLDSGVPLLRSLSVIADQVESKELAEVLSQIVRDVEGGQPFSRALVKHPRVFSPFWVSLVEVGEASGTMPAVLEKLTLYMEEAAAFRGAMVGAMVYPGVLLGICGSAVMVFAIFIGPIFERIFKDMNISLPGITAVVLSVFRFVKAYFFLLIGGAVGLFYLIKAYVSQGPGRRQFENLLFGLPVFGTIFKLIVVEKFTSQMAILIDSGVPILYALEISERLVENDTCAAVIKDIREGVREGRLLAETMEKSVFFPAMAVQMIRVGEETGELGKMLNHVAVFYKKNVATFLKGFATLIEPVMLVVMGGVIGVIVMAMFLPILSLSTGG